MLHLKLLWRDWRGGQLNLIVSALVLAVMVVSAVSLLADRVERGLDEQISSFLAADLAVQSSIATDPAMIQAADELLLKQSNILLFGSMVFAGDANHLASVKVVDGHYPLRGEIEVSAKEISLEMLENSSGNIGLTQILDHGPPAGEVWVESRLLSLLEIDLGETLDVGYASLVISRVIINEPDRGTGFSMTGARVMMNQADLASSQLVRPGSRISYRYLLAGPQASITQYTQWFEKYQLEQAEQSSHYRLRTPENSEQRLGEALQRGRAFLLLSGTIGVLLAGLAMALASQRYAARLTDQVALMKAWGQSANSVRRSQIIRLIAITTVACILGMALGWVAHFFLLEVAKGLFEAQLPAPSWRPWFVATVTGFVSVLGFAVPALWHLPSIAPLKVLRRDLQDSLVSKGRRLWFGIFTLLLLSYWYSGDAVVALMFMLALFALFLVCGLLSYQALKLVQRFGSWRGSFIRLGLSNLWRRREQTMVQLIGFSVTLMLLLVTTGMRTNLISEWQAQLPDDAPTHFLFNVVGGELDDVQTLLKEENVNANRWYSMVRGRLVKLNGETLSSERLEQTDGLAREVNFTQSVVLPEQNEIISGQWWDKEYNASDKSYFSIEQDVAKELGVVVGDVIQFSVGGLKLDATLSSIRKVNWDSMQANFYIIFSPGSLDRFTPNWMTSISTENSLQQQSAIFKQAPFVNKVIKQFPTAVVIEIGAVLAQIRNIINRVTMGLEMILLLVLACGALVLFAAIGVSYDERMRENAVLRTLGSSRKIVAGSLLVEFAVLGAIAGVIAVIGAEAILYTVQTELFELEPSLHPNLWGIGIVGGIVLISVLGLLRSKEIITVPPLQSLRQLS